MRVKSAPLGNTSFELVLYRCVLKVLFTRNSVIVLDVLVYMSLLMSLY